MKRDVMKRRRYTGVFEGIQQAVAIYDTLCSEEIGVEVGRGPVRDHIPSEESGIFEGFQGLMIPIPHRFPFSANLGATRPLDFQQRRQQIARHVAASGIHPRILIDFTTDERAAIGSFFTKDLGSGHHRVIADQQGAALATSDILGIVKAERPEIAQSTQRLAVPIGVDSLRRVLNHGQTSIPRKGHQGIHIARHSGVVNRHDRFRVRTHQSSHIRRIHVHGSRCDVRKNRNSAA